MYSAYSSIVRYRDCRTFSYPMAFLLILFMRTHLIQVFFILMSNLLVFKKNKFIYFWLHWVLVTARGLSLVVTSGGYSSLRCSGFSLRWLLLLRSTGSRRAGFSSCDSRVLERRLSSCGAQA